jgi:hypothetical protein
MRYLLIAFALGVCPAPAQESLTVRQAVVLALTKNGAVEASREGTKAAGSRIAEAPALSCGIPSSSSTSSNCV